MTLENYISKLGNRFVGMYQNDVCADASCTHYIKVFRIEVDLYSNNLDDSGKPFAVFGKPSNVEQEKQTIQVVKKEGTVYHFFTMKEGFGYNELFEHAFEVIEYNERTQKKNALIKQKMSEFAKLCVDLTYDELTLLKFVVEPETLSEIPVKEKKKRGRKSKTHEVACVSNMPPDMDLMFNNTATGTNYPTCTSITELLPEEVTMMGIKIENTEGLVVEHENIILLNSEEND